MDMNHQFLHRRTTGKVAPRISAAARANAGSKSITVFPSGQKPPLGEAVIIGGLRGRAPRARDLMTVRTEYPYQTLRMWTTRRTAGAQRMARLHARRCRAAP